ncbi:MAG TPA: FAD-dependent oxidoreductase [Ktedonobacteraceae bacterium]|jgi:D-amino-acid oxidase
MEILIIGCGVSGLTTGLSLLEAGQSVTIWARDLPPATTSNVAAAVWYPYKAYPTGQVTAWGRYSLHRFAQLQADPASGVFSTSVLELKPALSPDPWWESALEDFRHATPAELPPGYADGFLFAAPVIDTLVYMAYLVHTFQARGGQIIRRAVQDLAEPFGQCNVVVNCSGLGARELVGDRDLRPARGQVVRIKPTGARQVLIAEEGPAHLAYIVPRTRDIVLGGTYEEGNASTEIDPETTRSILRRCAALVPAFAAITDRDILQVACGLRPVRSTVRVEAERVAPQRLLVHNYGHGGAGITLSWGCAAEVVRLITEAAHAA